MATINLGNIKFNWQGAYNGATAYAVDDVVSYNGSSYICKLASTGNLPTNTTYFDVMSSAGTDGTDLTSTLTTQGDIVYRDGSGLQRLGAGTAGQVLQTGGTGANPSWGTVSSDFVHIADYTLSGNPNSWTVEGFTDPSVYKQYKIILRNWQSGQNGGWLDCRFKIASGVISSGSYHYTNTVQYHNSGGTTSPSGNGSWGSSILRLTQIASAADLNSHAEIDAWNWAGSNSEYPFIQHMSCGFDGSTQINSTKGFGVLNANQTDNITGIQFFDSGGQTITSGSVSVYGYKY